MIQIISIFVFEKDNKQFVYINRFMNKMTTKFGHVFLLLATVLVFSSCATVFGSKRNTIKVKAGTPEEAQVYLDGKYLGDTPFETRISKYELQEGSIIEIKKENYETMSYEVKRSPHVAYVISDLLGVVPLLIDVATGNIYRPNTRHIVYDLEKLNVKGIKTDNQPKKKE